MKPQTCWCLITPEGVINFLFAYGTRKAVIGSLNRYTSTKWDSLKEKGYKIRKINLTINS